MHLHFHGVSAEDVAEAIIWALVVPGADWLATHDVSGINGSGRVFHLQTAKDAARGRLLTLAAGVVATGALWFTARTFTLQRRTFELTEQGEVTDRYTKAIEQLGSDKLDMRIGGIYALERVARDSPRDHPTVIDVLAAFIREHSREQWPPAKSGAELPQRATRPDVQAAVTVIGRRNPAHDHDRPWTRVNLAGAKLPQADLVEANLSAVNLTGADLTGANLNSADLSGANLPGADLTAATLYGANLTGASLLAAILGFPEGFRGPDLTRTNLTGAELSGVTYPAGNPAPEGWVRDPEHGLLFHDSEDTGDAGERQ